MLFICGLDEVQTGKEAQANVLGEDIEHPVFVADLQHLRWSHFKDADPQTMYTRFMKAPEGQQTVFGHIESVGSEVGPFAGFMQAARPYVLSVQNHLHCSPCASPYSSPSSSRPRLP